MIQKWSENINSDSPKQLTAVHYLLYTIVRDRDIKKSFSPTVNPLKLQGNRHYWTLFLAMKDLIYLCYLAENDPTRPIIKNFLEPFGGGVTVDMMVLLNPILPKFEVRYGRDFSRP